MNIEAKRPALRAMRTAAMGLGRILTANGAISDDQLVALGLLPRRKRRSTQVPTDRPAVRVTSVSGHKVSLRLSDAASSDRRGRARGAASAWVYAFVGGVGGVIRIR